MVLPIGFGFDNSVIKAIARNRKCCNTGQKPAENFITQGIDILRANIRI